MRNVFYDSYESLVIFTRQTGLSKQREKEALPALPTSTPHWFNINWSYGNLAWKQKKTHLFWMRQARILQYNFYVQTGTFMSIVINNEDYSWASIVLLKQSSYTEFRISFQNLFFINNFIFAVRWYIII